jgi:hypothetical protein
MQGQLYRLKFQDNKAEWEGERGNRERKMVNRAIYIDVILPDATPYIPQTFVNVNGVKHSTDIEMAYSGRTTSKAVRLESVEYKMNESSYSGEQQELFQSLSRKALNDPGAREKLNAMLEQNKMVKQKMTVNYVIVLRIAKNEVGRWDWATEYSSPDVSTERLGLTVYEPESIGRESKGLLGPVFVQGSAVKGAVNQAENIAERSERKRSARALWAEKLECITSTDLIAEHEDKNEHFHWRENGKSKWESSVILLDTEIFGADEYYEDETTPEREWDYAFYKAMKDDEEFRDQVILLASILMACPKGKKLFLVCDHNPGKDGKKHNQGCGHNKNKCHTKFIAGLILNICNNGSGKNPYHDEAKEYAECWEVNPDDIQK